MSAESLIITVNESSLDKRGDFGRNLVALLVILAEEKKIEGWENLTPANFTVTGIYMNKENFMVGERIIVGITDQSDHEGNLFVNDPTGEVSKWDKEAKSWVKVSSIGELWEFAEPYLKKKAEFLTPKPKSSI